MREISSAFKNALPTPIETSNQWDSGKVSSILKYSISFISFYRETRKNVVSFRRYSFRSPSKGCPLRRALTNSWNLKREWANRWWCSDSIEIHGETNSWLRGVRDKEQSWKYTRPSFQSAFVTDRCRFNGPFRVHVDVSPPRAVTDTGSFPKRYIRKLYR